jgi:hypothetical protein
MCAAGRAAWMRVRGCVDAFGVPCVLLYCPLALPSFATATQTQSFRKRQTTRAHAGAGRAYMCGCMAICGRLNDIFVSSPPGLAPSTAACRQSKNSAVI